MQLGEGLSLRAKQAQKLADLASRIRQNSLTQEGTEPAENPETLIAQYLELSTAHGLLVERITRTNVHSELLDLLRQREERIRARNIHAAAASAAAQQGNRYMRSELRFEPQVDVADQQRLKEEADEEVRRLDARIQQLNWETTLE